MGCIKKKYFFLMNSMENSDTSLSVYEKAVKFMVKKRPSVFYEGEQVNLEKVLIAFY
jgi:hypothetical protein